MNGLVFANYRRFWTKNVTEKFHSFDDLNNFIIKKSEPQWNNYDVILGEPLIFKKIKNLKLIKKNIFEVIKNPKVLFKNNSLMDQFNEI